MTTQLQSANAESIQRKRYIRLALSLVALLGSVTLVHFITKLDATWTRLIPTVAITAASFIACCVTFYQAFSKKSIMKAVARTAVVLLFSATCSQCFAEFTLLSTSTNLASYKLDTTPLDLDGATIIGRVQADGTLADTNGAPMLDDNGNQLIAIGTTVMAKDSGGNVIKPNVALLPCIVGGAVLAGGTYAAVKLYCWAKKLLYPPTNAPPTNPPPTNPPATNPPAKKTLKTVVAKGTLSASTSVGTIGDCALAYSDTVGTNNWTDWQGNLITLYSEGTITNVIIDGVTNYFQVSSDLVHWVPEPCTIKSWVSISNVITVTGDQYGNPISTAWCARTSVTNATCLGAVTDVPRRAGVNQLFFKTAPLGQ